MCIHTPYSGAYTHTPLCVCAHACVHLSLGGTNLIPSPRGAWAGTGGANRAEAFYPAIGEREDLRNGT